MKLRNLIINPEFRDKIPPLSDDEYKKLEENILADGEVREPLVVWNDTIIDGHHRRKIIQKHPGLHYTVKDMDFADKWAAIVWMCRNQLGRRNLTDEQRTYLIGKQSEAEKMTEKFRGNQYVTVGRSETDQAKRGKTMQRIADEYGIGYGTVQRAEHFAKGIDSAEKVSQGFKDTVLSGAVKVPKSAISEIRNMPDEEKKETVKKIMLGESIPKKPDKDGKRYNGGGTKEYRESRESIEEITANMYDTSKPIVYTVDELIEEIRVNAEAYVKQLKRTLEIRSTLMTDENKPNIQDGIERYVFQELRKVADLLK